MGTWFSHIKQYARAVKSMTSSSILALIVTYHPDIKAVERLIQRLEQQVEWILVIDNATPGFNIDLPEQAALKTEIVVNPENFGVATAYNQGIKLAKARNATHIILFDQDSFPAENMVSTLAHSMNQYNAKQLQVAAAGPMYLDVKGQLSSPFVRLTGIRLERIACNEENTVDVDHLISSGCLIDLRAIDQIGEFTDSLFIDYVDTEWCWRARRHQLRLLGVGAAKMHHNLGEAHFMVLGKPCVLHSPFRLYYQIRNQWWMILQPWVGWKWRTMDVIRSVKIFVAISVFAPNRRKRIQYMCKGFLHALLSRMNKLQD